jgi:hypothetical protein
LKGKLLGKYMNETRRTEEIRNNEEIDEMLKKSYS